MLYQMANSALLDNALMSLDRGIQLPTAELNKLIQNVAGGYGNKLFGSLKSDIKKGMRVSFMNIPNKTEYLTKNGITEVIDIDQMISQLFEKKFIEAVFAKAGDITDSSKKLLTKISAIFSEPVNPLDQRIDDVIDAHITAIDETSKFINDTKK
jgi:hypothetical protein